MAVYPNAPLPEVGSTESHRLEAIRTETEAGYGMTRKKFTKRRVIFTLKYSNITIDECNILKDFFLANQGSVFTYQHDTLSSSESYQVMFAMDEFPITLDSGHLRSTSVSLISV